MENFLQKMDNTLSMTSVQASESSENLASSFIKYFDTRVHELYSIPGETSKLHQVMSYVLLGGGKKIRPLLCLNTAHMLAPDLTKRAFPAALAIEMVHTYSLVHDDLPCMDNDSMRRGRPTAHVQFDEASALLAGDALLTDAFTLLSESGELSSDSKIRLIYELSQACGSSGMALGQMHDLDWTGRNGYKLEDLLHIHRLKTALLIGKSCALGSISVGAKEEAIQQTEQFGIHLGLAFQMIDDLIDVLPGTGKSKGKDQKAGKLSFLNAIGEEKTKKMAQEATDRALGYLDGFGDCAANLKQFALNLLTRRS